MCVVYIVLHQLLVCLLLCFLLFLLSVSLLCFLLLLLSVSLLCFLLLWLSVSLLTPEEDNLCRNRSCAIVSLCFVALMNTLPWICSILSTSPAVVHSFLKRNQKPNKNKKQTQTNKQKQTEFSNNSNNKNTLNTTQRTELFLSVRGYPENEKKPEASA